MPKGKTIYVCGVPDKYSSEISETPICYAVPPLGEPEPFVTGTVSCQLVRRAINEGYRVVVGRDSKGNERPLHRKYRSVYARFQKRA